MTAELEIELVFF